MAISVGPTLFAILKYSLKHNYKAGIAFVLGVSASDIMYVVIANAAASWLQTISGYNRYIAYAGGTLLVIFGLAGLFKKHKTEDPNVEKLEISGGHYVKIWMGGFLINTINPGVILTWLSAVGATANATISYRVLLFGSCLGLILSIDFLKVFLAESIRRKLTAKSINFMHRLSAVILLVIGLFLIISSLLDLQFVKG